MPLSYWRRASSSLPCAANRITGAAVSAIASTSPRFFNTKDTKDTKDTKAKPALINLDGCVFVRRNRHELARRVLAVRAGHVDAILTGRDRHPRDRRKPEHALPDLDVTGFVFRQHRQTSHARSVI